MKRIHVVLIPAVITALLSLSAGLVLKEIDGNEIMPDTEAVPYTTESALPESFQESLDKKEQASGEDDQPPLKVFLKVFRIGLLRYYVVVKVKNEGEKILVLHTTRPAGGYMVINERNETIYKEPKYVPLCIYKLILWPGRSKTIYRDILMVKIKWLVRYEEIKIQGFLFNYPIKSEPIVISP